MGKATITVELISPQGLFSSWASSISVGGPKHTIIYPTLEELCDHLSGRVMAALHTREKERIPDNSSQGKEVAAS